jgi:4'-phosphopantetheinyl transferase
MLPANELHVWQAVLDQSSYERNRLHASLSSDERIRAASFRFARDRDRFVAARGVLRHILGHHYLNRDPRDLSFSRGEFGKLSLAADYKPVDLHFNLSHSDGIALFVFARGREVGVDLERVRSLAGDQIANHFFSLNEISTLQKFPSSQRLEVFYRLWTSKEAYLKARGQGLQIPLDSFDVSPIAAGSRYILRAENSTWLLVAFKPKPRYVATAAAPGHDWTLVFRQWQAVDAHHDN